MSRNNLYQHECQNNVNGNTQIPELPEPTRLNFAKTHRTLLTFYYFESQLLNCRLHV